MLYLSFFCASVRKMCPKVITSSLYAKVQLTKGLIGPLYFWTTRETCILNTFLDQLFKSFTAKQVSKLRQSFFLPDWRKTKLMYIW